MARIGRLEFSLWTLVFGMELFIVGAILFVLTIAPKEIGQSLFSDTEILHQLRSFKENRVALDVEKQDALLGHCLVVMEAAHECSTTKDRLREDAVGVYWIFVATLVACLFVQLIIIGLRISTNGQAVGDSHKTKHVQSPEVE